MDPVSLSVGVVALAMQIVQTASVIREHIDAYKSASKEVQALFDKLDHIECICNSLEGVLSSFEMRPKPTGTKMFECLNRALGQCRDRLAELYEVIKKITPTKTKTRNPLGKVGTLFLKHRATLCKCDDDLGKSLKVLHLYISTANLSATTFIMMTPPGEAWQYQTAAANPEEQYPMDVDAPQTQIVNRQQTKQKNTIQIEQQRHFWRSFYCFEQTKVTRKSPGFPGMPEFIVDDELAFVVGSPLYRFYIKLSLRRGPLSPFSFSFQIPHFMDAYTDICVLVEVLSRDDVPLFQRLLTERAIKLNTVVLWVGSCTMFGFATSMRAYKVCNFLMDHDPNLSTTELNYSPLSILRLPQTVEDSMSLCAKLYFDVKGPYLTIQDLLVLIFVVEHPFAVKRILNSCKEYFQDDLDSVNLCIFYRIVDCYRDSLEPSFEPATLHHKGWASLFQSIISDDLDVHNTNWDVLGPNTFTTNGHTALQSILLQARNPMVAQDCVRAWTSLVEESGIDVEKYLDTEYHWCASNWDNQDRTSFESRYKREFSPVKFKNWSMPCWDFAVSESCPVRELLLEYPYISREAATPIMNFPIDIDNPHRAWKNTECAQWGWDIVRPPLSSFDVLAYSGRSRTEAEGQIIKESRRRAQSLMQSRFNRRQMKKLRKARSAKGEFIPRKPMPGTWHDEYDL
ncbi:Fc.00g077220.m01.CDS01 [Cosmosporella sp. VM-42]